MLKTPFIYILVFTIMFSMGCGTDVKPNYFIGMFRNANDIDRLSGCLSEIPQIDEDGNIVITADQQCLIDLSNQDTTDPNQNVTFTEILNDPEAYLDRIVTFEATLKKVDYGSTFHLYTNRNLMDFVITSHGADIFTLDENGEEVELYRNQQYEFTTRIYEIKINDNKIWEIKAEFIITENKEVIHQPVPITE